MDFLAGFGAGLLAGLAVAVPLGAVGVLLMREGLAHGFTTAAPAAVGVALTDAAYCALAVTAGRVAAPVIAGQGDLPVLIGGMVLIGLGLAGSRRSAAAVPAGRGSQPGTADPASPGETTATAVGARQGLRRFGLFAGLTALNPATLVYFAALALGLGGVLAAPAGAAAFVLGVALASLGWQLGLVFTGAFFRGRLSARAQRRLALAGCAVVVLVGLAAVLSTIPAAG